MKKQILVLFLALLLQSAYAHIGSPDIVYEGNAGPYKLSVVIRPPDVVPGLAHITISVPGQQVRNLNIQPVYYQYGSEGAPPADPVSPVSGAKDTYEGSLWLMSFGSSSVKISLEGARGFGATIIPVPAIATATHTMNGYTEWGLAGMAIFLFLSFVSIIGASVREATLPPGKYLSRRQRKRKKRVMIFTGAFVLLLLWFCAKWWDKVDREYRRNMYKPITLVSEVKTKADSNFIYLKLVNRKWLDRKIKDLIPDHGKLMHAFLVRTDQKVFGHLHPLRNDTLHFYSSVSAFPSGRYSIFADIVHSNGFSETLSDTVIINRTPDATPFLSDMDDAVDTITAATGPEIIRDNLVIRLGTGALRAGRKSDLQFSIRDLKGGALHMQPYLGMAGHAVVMKDDGKVFIHLHPMGTISMASQYSLANKLNEEVTLCGTMDSSATNALNAAGVFTKDMTSVMPQNTSADPAGNSISFPYAFPSPGEYYIWLQVKVDGRIHTGAFKVSVGE